MNNEQFARASGDLALMFRAMIAAGFTPKEVGDAIKEGLKLTGESIEREQFSGEQIFFGDGAPPIAGELEGGELEGGEHE